MGIFTLHTHAELKLYMLNYSHVLIVFVKKYMASPTKFQNEVF